MRVRRPGSGRPRVALLLLAAACGGDLDTTAPPTPSRIEASRAAVTLAALEDTVRLTATVRDQFGAALGVEIRWVSANPGVATVSPDGLLTAVSNGECVVTARSGGLSADVGVTVAQVPVQVSVSGATRELTVEGDTLTLVATARDARSHLVLQPSVQWSSSAPAVASVDAGGLVRAAADGEATITASVASAVGSEVVRVNLLGPWIDTPALAPGLLGTAYLYDLAGHVPEGEAGLQWSLAGGSLPQGVALGSDGRLSGTPSTMGASEFVVRLRDPSTGRSALRAYVFTVYCQPGDCIGRSFKTWFAGSYSEEGPGLFLSTASFQHGAPWVQFGMAGYSRIPRVALVNDAADQYYPNLEWAWVHSYMALQDVAAGLEALGVPEIAAGLPESEVVRTRAFARFVQGISLATLGILYDKAFLVDAVTARPDSALSDWREVVVDALACLGEAAALADRSAGSLPFEWMRSEVTLRDLSLLARAMRARYRAGAARTPEDREAVDWAKVVEDARRGLGEPFALALDPTEGWGNGVTLYQTFPGWTETPYWIIGMADQSGSYQAWLDQPLADRVVRLADGTNLLIRSPDTRFPQGSTFEEQVSRPGTVQSTRQNISGMWARPDRGTWRWSFYLPDSDAGPDKPFKYTAMDPAEMRLLEAEGLYRMGDLAGAASRINQSRTAAGLQPTDAAGTNTECVPRLRDGTCGDLWEMLKWEKRMETYGKGLLGAPWYFDSRGWGDLWKGTFLQLPTPCGVLTRLGLTCYTFGGSGDGSAPQSTYQWPDETG